MLAYDTEHADREIQISPIPNTSFMPKLMLTNVTAIMCMANELNCAINSNTAKSAIQRGKQKAAHHQRIQEALAYGLRI